MSAGDSKVIFHRSKNTGDENLPDSWNDLSIVNAYDAAVSNKVNNRITYDDLVYENASNSKDTSVEAPSSKAKKSRKRRKKNGTTCYVVVYLNKYTVVVNNLYLKAIFTKH